MKQLLQTLQYVVAAVVIFTLMYFTYLFMVGLSAFVLPVFFLAAVAVVVFTRHNKGDQ